MTKKNPFLPTFFFICHAATFKSFILLLYKYKRLIFSQLVLITLKSLADRVKGITRFCESAPDNKPIVFYLKPILLTELYLTYRNNLLKANKTLSHVLVEVLKTTAAAEETLGLHMQSLSPSRAAAPHSEPLRASNS